MRVALYSRVSSEEQATRGLSVDAQVAALDAWAKENGHTVVDHYNDLGVSGRKPYNKRAEMMRLLDDVAAKKIDLIAFCKLDRWFRSVKEFYRVQDILDKNKVAWRTIQEDYETETSSGRFKVNIMLSVAQSEAEKTGDRVRAVVAYKRLKGEFCSGNTPVGTKLENKTLVPSEDAWKVKAMFDAFLSVGSVTGSIPILERQGISVGNRSLRYILDNENYLKVGIISPEEWSRVRELRASRRPVASRKRTYLFTGLLYCPRCGKKLAGMYGKTYYYYRCPRYYQDRSCSMKGCIPEDRIEEFFLETIEDKLKAIDLTIREGEVIDPTPYRRRIEKLTDLFLHDMISREKFEKEYLIAKTTLEEAENAPTPIDMEQVMSALDAYHLLSREAKRAFWYRTIKKATVSEDGVNYSLSFTENGKQHCFMCLVKP